MNEELKFQLQAAGKVFSTAMINLMNDVTDDRVQKDKRIVSALKELVILMNYVYVVSNDLKEVSDDLGYSRLEKTAEVLWGIKEVREELFNEKREHYKNVLNYPDIAKYQKVRTALRESENDLKIAARNLIKIERICRHIAILCEAYRQYIDDREFLDAELKNSKLEKVSKIMKYIPFLSKLFS